MKNSGNSEAETHSYFRVFVILLVFACDIVNYKVFCGGFSILTL